MTMKKITKNILLLTLILALSLAGQTFDLMNISTSDRVAISAHYIVSNAGVEQYIPENTVKPFAISSLDTFFVGMQLNTTFVGGEDFMPVQTTLAQNYPNPFNSATVIRYAVNEPSSVTITIYDITGREIATLVKEQKTSGVYSVGFNKTNIASGTYLYRMIAHSNTGETKIETKKMIVMK
jgi:hypothetical protein